MAKYIFISGSYDPYPTANGVCAKAIERGLKNARNEVVYIVPRHNLNQAFVENINGNTVYFVPKSIDEVHKNISLLLRNSLPRPEKGVLKVAYLFVRILFKLLALFRFKSTREVAFNKYKAQSVSIIKSLIENENPYAIVTFSVPFDSHLFTHEALLKMKNKPKWFIFMFDAHSYRDGTEIEAKRFREQELLCFREADKCFLLDVLETDYSQYNEFKDKIQYFHLPFLQIPLKVHYFGNCINTELNKINFLFAGTLYDQGRPVDYLVDYIEEFAKHNSQFHLIGKIYPENLEKILSLNSKYNGIVKYYGRRERSFVLESLTQADCLINISNNNSNQIPSKILEYIGMVKPIVTFSRTDFDASSLYLDRYPLSLVIDERKTPSMDGVQQTIQFLDRIDLENIKVEDLRPAFEGLIEDDVVVSIIKHFS